MDTTLFFITLALTRLFRFGLEAVLAYFYGRQIIRWLESDVFEYIGIALFAVAIIGTTIGVIQLIRKTRAHRQANARRVA